MQMFDKTADVIVVGLGAVGAAAAYQLARRGVSVLGIDRYAPPHDQGSSHGETRVTREATGEGAQYVPFVQRSHAIWRELEAETGEVLFKLCGFLAIDGSAGAALRHGKSGFFDGTVTIAEQFGIPYGLPTHDDIRRCYPAFRMIGDERLFFEPGAGIVYPEKAISVQLRLAARHGARLLTNTPVQSIVQMGDGVAVQAGGDVYHASRALVCAGAWTPGLAGEPQLRLLRQTLHWFETSSDRLPQPDLPTFLWLDGPDAEDSFYGFPRLDGKPVVKLATEQFTTASATPEAIKRAVPHGESEAMYRRYVAGRLLGVTSAVRRAAACIYTHAEGGRFLIDHSLHSDRIVIASACSGHGFKHSAAVGEHLAQVIRGDEPLRDAFRRRSRTPEHVAGTP